MPQSPQERAGSKRYRDAWRAINELIRSEGSWSGHERNVCYLNTGDGKFEDVSFISGLDLSGDGRSFVALDIDHDGDLDLALSFRTAPGLRILRNDYQGPNRSLLIELVGTKSNHDAVGARAALQTSRRTLFRHVRCGSGFLSQTSRRLHFGLEPGEQPKTLEVWWPSRNRQQYEGLPDHGALRLTEGKAAPQALAARPSPTRIETPEPQPRTPGTWLVEPLPAPDFALHALDGRTEKLSHHKGRKVLLNFWATWCPPCRNELAGFAARAPDLKTAGVDLLAVSVDEAAAHNAVGKFVKDNALSFPVLLADDTFIATYSLVSRHLFDRRRDLALPTSFLIDEVGRIVKAYVGPASASAVLLDAASHERPALPFDGKWYNYRPQRNYVDLATAMAERGLHPQAQALFATALASGRADPEVLNNFAALLLEDGELQRAETLLRRSLQFDAGQAEVYANLGTLLLRRNRPEQALSAFEEARRRESDDAYVYNGLGSAYFALGKLEPAQQMYREAVRLAPDSADYRYNLGTVLTQNGRYQEALQAFEEVRKHRPDSVELLNNIAILYAETGQPERGLQEFLKTARRFPQHAGTALNLALYYQRAGRLDSSLRWLEKARKLDPNSPTSYLVEAHVLLALGRSSEAKATLHKVLALHPDLEEAKALLQSIR